MKKSSTIFLQAVLVALGAGALALLLWEPWLEGVNAHATTLAEIYFDDPFLALVYTGSIPFFIALYQAFRVLGYIRQDRVFSEPAVRALRTVKYCALAVIGFVAAEEIFIMLNHGNDDAAGGIAMGLFIALGSVIAAAAAALLERLLRNAVDMKAENDLTV